MEIEVRTPGQAVVKIAKTVQAEGEHVSPRGEPTVELRNVQTIIKEPWHMPFEVEGRDMKHFIGAVEGLQLVSQTTIPSIVTNGSSPFKKFMNDGVFHGAYGARIHGRVAEVVELLTKDPDSRQAVLTIFSSDKDLSRDKRDIPCTLSLQFFIRNGRLECRTNMRSNDVWLGLPYDLVQFITLHGAIAAALKVPMGQYVHSVGSIHAYERDLSGVDGLSQTPDVKRPYTELWSGDTIEQIVTDALEILMTGSVPQRPTDFELYLAKSILAAR